ncbi:TlpA family protein disulfide reductase [Salinadaptatus halalkaliphilus]|uniref:TlpA family protein disulfide reductase n=1 Tax=Salinadaptatus halalkaliphilus TaxID=2419781 RepID=A0A4S3TPB7_9EURY|nr:TlpA disulfide reductase family protein [Salinadaptatus halalkaliphilus]THE66184.1 TlpA family protein disulfide reductase [Salinadaptatus halalkaliphilus]
MRRRDILAGLGSIGVLGGAGAVAVYGLPSSDALLEDGPDGDVPGASGDDGNRDGERDGEGAGIAGDQDPLEIETIDAQGSEAGTELVPAPDRATFIDIFGTWCPPCIEQMPALAEANDRIGDEVLFMSVTNESVGENAAITEDELREWWADNDGDWTVGLDRTAELTERYLAGGYPSAVAIDASGTVQWSDSGVKTADELVAGIEQALEASEDR